MKREFKNRNNWITGIIILIILILVILIYIVTIGKYDLTKENSNTDNRLKWIDKRLSKLSNQLDKKKNLKYNLDNIVIRAYFATRVSLMLFYFSINIVCYYFIRDLGLLLNLNQVVFILFLAITFVLNDKPSDLFLQLKKLRLKIKRLVYRKYLRHINSIDQNSKEIKELEIEKDNLTQQIESIQ